jgi:hypothetical protein
MKYREKKILAKDGRQNKQTNKQKMELFSENDYFTRHEIR